MYQMCDNQVVNGETKAGGCKFSPGATIHSSLLTTSPDAEYVILRSEATVRVPDHVDAAKYAPILCAGMTVFNSLRHMDVKPGETVAVQGLGGLGHLAIQAAQRMGYRVVAISRGADKEAFARQLGAHDYIDSSKEDAGEALRKLGGARLAMTTAPTAEVMGTLLKGLGPMGKLLILSVPGEVPVNTGVMVSCSLGKAILGRQTANAKTVEICPFGTILALWPRD